MSKAAHEVTTEVVREDGWRLVRDAPQPPQRRRRTSTSVWNATHGGMAFVIEDGVPAETVLPNTATTQCLWDSGRWMHDVSPIGVGHQNLHLMNIYGYSGAIAHPDRTAQNEQLLKDVLNAAASLGNVPILICGDFNVEPERSPVLRAALGTGRWLDAAASIAANHGGAPAATCFKNAASPGTRIDVALCNAVAGQALQEFEVLHGVDVKTHRPIIVKFNLDAYRQKAYRLTRPKAFAVDEFEEWPEEEEFRLAAKVCNNHADKFRTAMTDANVEAAWAAWCGMAEGFLWGWSC